MLTRDPDRRPSATPHPSSRYYVTPAFLDAHRIPYSVFRQTAGELFFALPHTLVSSAHTVPSLSSCTLAPLANTYHASCVA